MRLSHARTIIATWVAHYNSERLHAGLGYLTPAEFYRGNPTARIVERQEKLDEARRRRQQVNEERSEQAA